MSEYDVIVIGAGNGGLTSACALAQGGLKTLLLEKHNIPGGCATSFCRGRFEFETALHQLSGLGTPQKPGPLRRVLDSLGVTDLVEWVEMENLYRIVVPGQLDILLKADREAAVDALKERFPAESSSIEAFFDLIYQYHYEAIQVLSRRDPEIAPEKYPKYFKYALKTAQDVLDDFFHDPALKLAVSIYWSYLGLPPSKLPFAELASLLAIYLEYKPHYMKGGSQTLSNAIITKFLEYGGTVRFNSRVEKILVENHRVTGVVTETGETIKAKYVVSNASPVTVFTELIESKHVPKEEIKRLGGQTIAQSIFGIWVGLDCEPSEIGLNEATNFICPNCDMDEGYAHNLRIDTDNDPFMVTCYNLSAPDFSPPGTSNVVIVDLKYGEPWLTIPPDQYFEKKYECAEKLLERVEQLYPGFREHIEEIEVATPITHMRYLATPAGGAYGFDKYLKESPLFKQKFSLIKGLHFVGAWVGPGAGFPPTLIYGRSVARSIVKDYMDQVGVQV